MTPNSGILVELNRIEREEGTQARESAENRLRDHDRWMGRHVYSWLFPLLIASNIFFGIFYMIQL